MTHVLTPATIPDIAAQEEFEALCFEYGIELDDVTSEREMVRKELGVSSSANSGQNNSALEDVDDDVIYKIDIPANRYDMLCLEGISRALNVFRGKIDAPRYTVKQCPTPQRLTVKPETALVRPFVVAAVLRGVRFNPSRYNSFIDLQDKLHQNLCRHRTLVAIGTHDLSKVKGPFTYEALPPEDITFTPLKQSREFNAKELLEYYAANDLKLKKYVPIIQSSLVYPVILDSERTVLSLPPVINGAKSAISLDTRDVFIECTATDLTKAKIVLNTMCAMYSEYCETPFEIEPVEVVDATGSLAIYPDVSPKQFDVDMRYVNTCTGLDIDASLAATLLKKMQLEATADGHTLRVEAPITRSDILHSCDVMEDVAIAYGYDNLVIEAPKIATSGRENPLSQLCELLRVDCATSGFTEVLTWALCSRKENFTDLRVEDTGGGAVAIGNPATAEFEVCRTTLLPGILKTLGANKDTPLPVKLFEVSDVILLDESSDVGARNERRLIAVNCDTSSGFEVVHGLLNRVMQVLGVPHESLSGNSRKDGQRIANGFSYSWKADESETYFTGRHASVYAMGKRIGELGVVHPEVLQAFDIQFPVSALEINLEPFVFDQNDNLLPTHM
jgi:phenylalanyl-tRNA synthetase beta chain